MKLNRNKRDRTGGAMYQTLQYECVDGIATVRFNRPGKLNAINPEMIESA